MVKVISATLSGASFPSAVVAEDEVEEKDEVPIKAEEEDAGGDAGGESSESAGCWRSAGGERGMAGAVLA